MIIGERKAAPISARDVWNETGIVLDTAGTYLITTEGTWWDWFVPCDADGYKAAVLAKFEARRRVPSANWFALCGAIERDAGHPFVIGRRSGSFRPPQSGELTCFANDLPEMYWNNWGRIDIVVTRIG